MTSGRPGEPPTTKTEFCIGRVVQQGRTQGGDQRTGEAQVSTNVVGSTDASTSEQPASAEGTSELQPEPVSREGSSADDNNASGYKRGQVGHLSRDCKQPKANVRYLNQEDNMEDEQDNKDKEDDGEEDGEKSKIC
ncbi:hypothetical protein DSO57_1032936 [Entomophthora muscae]|uniref:Uncharacterized protein n=1 Tax=Entomophthora muscae TaxID=34485 RepID=A0ACC2S2E0_9FUNG|nr:hypothetical protein DSO57_1032936 [Entomophthora muscae]